LDSKLESFFFDTFKTLLVKEEKIGAFLYLNLINIFFYILTTTFL